MTKRDRIISRAAAAALAFGLAASGGSALAQQAPANPDPNKNPAPVTEQAQTPKAPVVIPPAANTNNHEIVTTWSPTVDPINPLGSHVPLNTDILIAMIAGLGILSAAAGAYGARKGVKGSWLRAGAGGIIALALLNPEILREDREKLPTVVLKVVDRSASNQLDGRDKTTQAASDALDKSLSALPGVEVRTIDITGTNKDGAALDGTNPFTAVNNLTDLPRDQLGAVIMLTDGQIHDVPVATDALGKGVPLHVLVSGRENEVDRRIVVDSAPHFGLVNKKQDITFHVEDQGAKGPSAPVTVTVSSEGHILSTQQVTPGQPVKMTVDIPHAGPNIIEFKTEPLKGELTPVNNQTVATIEGIREQLNVMLITGKPNPDTRLFREMIRSNPDDNLIHFMIQRLPTQLDDTPDSEMALAPFPFDEVFEDKLSKFNLIIFDNFDDQGVVLADYLENISKFVKNGGAVLVVAGDEFDGPNSLKNTPLGAILPVQPGAQADKGDFTPQLTDLGRRHPVTRDLDPSGDKQPHWGPWSLLTETGQPTGEVVMEGPNKKPLLVLANVGKGRVAVLASSSLNLWKNGYQGSGEYAGGPYGEIIRNISGWLMKDPALEEEALRMAQQDGKLVIERQTVEEKTTPITIHTPSGQTMTIDPVQVGPGLWRATEPLNELGLYKAEQGGKHPVSTFINIGPVNPKEFVNTISSTEIVRNFTRGTGGSVSRMGETPQTLKLPRIEQLDAKQAANGAAGPDWIGIHMRDASNLKDTNRTPIIPPWLALVMAVGLYAGARWREGELGSPFRKKEPAPDTGASPPTPKSEP